MKKFMKKISAWALALVLAASAVAGTGVISAQTVKADEVKTGLSDENEAVFKTVFENISANCEGSSDWYAMCAAAIGQASKADIATIKANAIQPIEQYDCTTLQKNIIILSALGEDVTAVDDGVGGTINLLENLYTGADYIGSWSWAESVAYTLMAYAASGQSIPDSAVNAPATLVDLLKNNYRTSDGGYGYAGDSCPDTTGAVIASFVLYKNIDGVQTMIDDAVASLKASQNADGGFGYAVGTETNTDSTALAIIGLCAAGIDPTSADFTKDGKNPVTALLALVNDTQDGFPGWDADLATSEAFHAMVAYSGFRNTGAAYNVYVDAKNAGAAYKAPVTPEPETTEAATETTKAATPKAGDSTNISMILVVIAICCIALPVATLKFKK